MMPSCPLHWLRSAGFTIRPWTATHWWILHPATRAISILTLPELATLVRCLERDFRPWVVTPADASTRN